MFSKYESNQKLKDAATLWESGSKDVIEITNEDGTKEFANGTIKGVPPFHKPEIIEDMKSKTFVCESENCYAFIPGAFRGGSTPNKMQPVRFEIGGEGSLQSLVHTLVVPKTIRKISCDTLQVSDESLINEMKELGKKSVQMLIEGDEHMIGSLKWQLELTGEVEIDGTMISMELKPGDMSPMPLEEGLIPAKLVQEYKEYKTLPPNIMGSLRQSFHRYGHYTIASLHMHTYMGNFITLAHDKAEEKYEGDFKNVHVDDVMHYIKDVGQLEDGMDGLCRTQSSMSR